MNAVVKNFRDDVESTYAVDSNRDREPMKARARFPEYRRRGSAPSSAGGMHCRRSKRWTWGSGRGARALNMRAFAGAVAFIVASVASTVLGSTVNPADMVTIGNPGNAGYVINGLGAVSYTFAISKYETTNKQYADFLNAVGGSNPNNIYDARMASDPNGGIVQSGTSGSFTYAVKSVPNPMGAAYATAPVNFVSWFSAARFVNWLHNGESNDQNSIENGSYALMGATSGALPGRSPNATFVLPSIDEWFKAGFNNGGLTSTDYTTWATNSASRPATNVSNTTLANVANYGGLAAGSSGPLAVGSYTNSLSHYGVYEMMGNVAEMTDTANPGNVSQWAAMSGSYNTAAASLASFAAATLPSTYANGTAVTPQIGFRVAQVAAVPEPSTYALLAAGVTGLGGLRWVKRRRQIAA